MLGGKTISVQLTRSPRLSREKVAFHTHPPHDATSKDMGGESPLLSTRPVDVTPTVVRGPGAAAHALVMSFRSSRVQVATPSVCERRCRVSPIHVDPRRLCLNLKALNRAPGLSGQGLVTFFGHGQPISSKILSVSGCPGSMLKRVGSVFFKAASTSKAPVPHELFVSSQPSQYYRPTLERARLFSQCPQARRCRVPPSPSLITNLAPLGRASCNPDPPSETVAHG